MVKKFLLFVKKNIWNKTYFEIKHSEKYKTIKKKKILVCHEKKEAKLYSFIGSINNAIKVQIENLPLVFPINIFLNSIETVKDL